MFTKELFGQRLKSVRKAAKENQEVLAAVINVTKSQISEMESGKKTTTVEKVALICEHYGISSDYLLGLKDEQ